MKQRVIRVNETQDKRMSFGQVISVLKSSSKRPKKNSFTFIML